jgi:hypothetical protein
VKLDPSVSPDIEKLPTRIKAINAYAKLIEELNSKRSEKVTDPFFHARRLSIEFTTDIYSWPKDTQEIFANLTSVCLTTCCGAAVQIKCDDWMVFDRCVNVRIDGINMFYTSADAGLNIMGGKSVRLRNMLVRRPHSDGSAAVRLSAKREIDLSNLCVALEKAPGSNRYWPALHIWNARAHTVLNNVESNGDLILELGVPSRDNDPVARMTAAAGGGQFNSTFGLLKNVHNSSNTYRVEACKFHGILPGNDQMAALQEWAEGKGGVSQGGSLAIPDSFVSNIALIDILEITAVARATLLARLSKNTQFQGEAVLADEPVVGPFAQPQGMARPSPVAPSELTAPVVTGVPIREVISGAFADIAGVQLEETARLEIARIKDSARTNPAH